MVCQSAACSPAVAAGFAGPFKDRSSMSTVGKVRYEDDLALISKVFCSKCLEAMPGYVHQPPIKFEPTAPAIHGYVWLDRWLQAGCGELVISTGHVEEERVQSGSALAPARFRVPPFLGNSGVDVAALGGRLSGLQARWRDSFARCSFGR